MDTDPHQLIEQAWKSRRNALGLRSESEIRRVILDEVYPKLERAVSLFRQLGNNAGLIVALGKLAHVKRDLSDNLKAQAMLEEAVALGREKADSRLLAHSIRHLGEIYREAGKAPLASECFAESVAIYRALEQPPPLDLANALTRLAADTENKEPRDAHALWQEARDLYDSLGLDEGVEECKKHLAKLSPN